MNPHCGDGTNGAGYNDDFGLPKTTGDLPSIAEPENSAAHLWYHGDARSRSGKEEMRSVENYEVRAFFVARDTCWLFQTFVL